MNLLSLLCFSQLSHAGNGWVHGPSDKVIGDVYHLELSNLSGGGNGGSLEPFQWRISCENCRKKVVKGAGIFCRKFCVNRGNTLHARGCDAKVVTLDIQRMTYLSLGKSREDIGK